MNFLVHIFWSKLKIKFRVFSAFRRKMPETDEFIKKYEVTSDFAVLILEILSDQVCLRNNGFFQMFDFC